MERNNKLIKTELGSKHICNWVAVLNFINSELKRINDKKSKNENKNVLYESKHTKFGMNKYNINDEQFNNWGN